MCFLLDVKDDELAYDFDEGGVAKAFWGVYH
jgi:hypothetical protein